ncbi:aminoacyl-tRNA hydrolase [candidate division WOR-1 bacterium RIFOXYA12_FULL_52_29]|uniref:Peptidyl-tRNA hydrolase n=1 Tax=candidate division WOR-1 bacterium RIFOXYC12_FULL_54_18 TaxID=1802584 RepID=A0A1F4T825_UNCSA|nr:MAG: aminoacyl-tRNA hydrolase [candidate division WOR-1 bacterium RIFOXYA2_FULL_51_19]OGC17816.1 MAG: aminoacyl-tRNA hydrolase [candidate division WOR-1 bacterium RIFOXYA12_FULL_52_29]OGC26673.1 MAG: aminoacyl-tRNA hydrolase [candidate division WOR-1 bacterium RIFOXYB2_FULL_45_9]OGC28233.1 MAG: aminoacyl-tRNA hydrolase [candidate division WOR-1 bacterium RIFOXYC12_FULL_54_18]OGC29479.1 MAG: aminoacyl-tRNA hydrolase [candidate division WOR-1 bacterium RIFOXYB12_FULL_52_16]
MFLIVGLGNPGEEYARTRHNLGFMVVDELASRLKISSFKSKHRSFTAESMIGEHKVVLAKPQTYMNNSGQAAQELLSWHKIPPARMIVIYDDVDLETGVVRVRESGSAGGHHGIESIMNSLNSGAFIRVRVGIGRPTVSGDVASYVLGLISKDQSDSLAAAIETAADAALEIISHGPASAMNKFNA